jgi:hypothetical protein
VCLSALSVRKALVAPLARLGFHRISPPVEMTGLVKKVPLTATLPLAAGAKLWDKKKLPNFRLEFSKMSKCPLLSRL